MTRPEQRTPDLRVAVPTLEPDDVFLAQLSTLAASTPTASTSATGTAWRAALAAASVVAVVGGGAALANTLSQDPEQPPTSPLTRPADPVTSEPERSGAGGHPSRDHDVKSGGSDSGSSPATEVDGPESQPATSGSGLPAETDGPADSTDGPDDDGTDQQGNDDNTSGDDSGGDNQGDDSDGGGDDSGDSSGDDSGDSSGPDDDASAGSGDDDPGTDDAPDGDD